MKITATIASYFENHKDDSFLFTSDGLAWRDTNEAIGQARALKDNEVVTITRAEVEIWKALQGAATVTLEPATGEANDEAQNAYAAAIDAWGEAKEELYVKICTLSVLQGVLQASKDEGNSVEVIAANEATVNDAAAHINTLTTALADKAAAIDKAAAVPGVVILKGLADSEAPSGSPQGGVTAAETTAVPRENNTAPTETAAAPTENAPKMTAKQRAAADKIAQQKAAEANNQA